MRQFQEFDAERRRVRTLADWKALAARWFDLPAWPTRSQEQRLAESAGKQGPVSLGGRRWSYTSWAYDLTPEARYEYFATLRRIGDPLRFPGTKAGPGKAGWRQECPHCEISTDEPGDPVCPRCGRELIEECYSR